MVPNVYTAILFCEFQHQERLRDAARERLAASIQPNTPSPLALLRIAPQFATDWRPHVASSPRTASQPVRIAPLGTDPGAVGRSTA